MSRMAIASLSLLLLLVSVGILCAADINVTIKEWDTPGQNAGPHDTEVAPDGSLWYTGQGNNTLGRLDPKTGKIQVFNLKTPGSGPHGLVTDNDGNVWFTANAKGYIGKLDPKTGKVTLKQSPTPRSAPYGLRLDSKGDPWYCEFNSNKLAHIDRATFEIKEYLLPEGARPRRLAVAPDDRVYYSDHIRGYLGRLDPKTGKVEEWPSPGGPNSRPYAILTMSDGIVWYSESNVTPNTLVRFDPKDNSFMKWPIPSGGGVLRHFVATKDGKQIYIAGSGVNKVGIVDISRK